MVFKNIKQQSFRFNARTVASFSLFQIVYKQIKFGVWQQDVATSFQKLYLQNWTIITVYARQCFVSCFVFTLTDWCWLFLKVWKIAGFGCFELHLKT